MKRTLKPDGWMRPPMTGRALLLVAATVVIGSRGVAGQVEPPFEPPRLTTLGASQVVVTDALADQSIAEHRGGTGSVVYQGDVLVLEPDIPGRPQTYQHVLAEDVPVVRMSVSMSADPGSRVAVSCVSSQPGSALAAVISAAGALIGRSSPSGFREQGRVVFDRPLRPGARVAVECAAETDDIEHMAVWADGELVIRRRSQGGAGPYGTVILSVARGERPGSVSLGGLDIWAGPEYRPVEHQAATERVHQDRFDPSSDWPELDEVDRSIRIDDGRLRIDLSQQGVSVASLYRLQRAAPSMRVAGDVDSEGPQIAGVMCGTESPSPDGVIGALLPDGRAIMARMIGDEVRLIESARVRSAASEAQPMRRITLDCLAGTGGHRLVLYLDGDLVTTAWLADGPSLFDRAGVYAESISGPTVAWLDDLAVYQPPG